MSTLNTTQTWDCQRSSTLTWLCHNPKSIKLKTRLKVFTLFINSIFYLAYVLCACKELVRWKKFTLGFLIFNFFLCEFDGDFDKLSDNIVSCDHQQLFPGWITPVKSSRTESTMTWDSLIYQLNIPEPQLIMNEFWDIISATIVTTAEAGGLAVRWQNINQH